MKNAFLLPFFSLLILAHTVEVWAQEKVIDLSTYHSGAHDYVARDTIYLKPGFGYTGTNYSRFTGRINQSIQIDADYIESPPLIGGHTPDKSRLVGAIPGEFNVSPSGGAVYQFPIEIPSGIGGIQPAISLLYNSQSGNGIAGWGFNISSLSAITRVPKTIYSDGNASGVKSLKDDAYALDGNRLVLVSGTYGEDGAVYHTETETFSQITSFSTDNNIYGPSRFEALAKDGSVFKYGSASGRLYYYYGTFQSFPQLWCLDYYESPNGQTIKYEYERSYSQTSLLIPTIKKITYGFNDCHTIEFFYEKREDKIPLFFNRKRGETDKLLRSIVVKCSGELYRSYSFEYAKDYYSRLVKIKIRDEEGELLNPTVLEWNMFPESPELYTTATSVTEENVYERNANKDTEWYLAADVDGDGISDLIRIYYTSTFSSNIHVGMKKSVRNAAGETEFHVFNTALLPGGFFNNVNKNYLKPGGILIGDIFGKGKQNIVFPYYSSSNAGQVLFYILNDGNTHQVGRLLNYSRELPVVAVADINNNGKSEILYIEKGKKTDGKYVLTIMSPGETSEPIDIPLALSASPVRIFAADFNADGMQDLLVLTKEGYDLFWNQGGPVNTCFGDAYKVSETDIKSSFGFVEIGDFDGDGLPDFLVNRGVNVWSVLINTGQGKFNITNKDAFSFLADYMNGSYEEEQHDIIITDFDGDGKSDVIVGINKPEERQSVLSWLRSTGNEFEKTAERTMDARHTKSPFNRYLVSGDFRGKGKPEILFYGFRMMGDNLASESTSEKAWKYYHSGSPENLGMLTAVADGLGNQLYLDYEYLSTSPSYVKGASINPSVIHLQVPLSVVKKAKSISAVTNITEYRYSGAMFHREGRGFLGFEGLTAIDSTQNRKMTTISMYNAEYFYPYVYGTYISTLDNKEISVTTNKFSHLTYGGKRIFPYMSSQKVEDKLGLLTVLTETSLDNYGNPVAVKTTRDNRIETQSIEYIQKGSWCLNKPSRLTLEKKFGNDRYTRVSAYEYDEKGNLTKETLDPGHENQVVTEYKDFNEWGQPRTVDTKAGNITRTVTKEYNARGLVTMETDVFGQTTRYVWNNNRDELISAHDRIGTTSFRYNRLGEVSETYYPDGTMERNNSYWADTNSDGILFYTLSEASGTAPVYTRYNASGQEVMRDVYDWKNRRIRVTQSYGTDGKLLAVSEPTFGSSASSNDIEYTYDGFGRVVKVVTPQGTTSTEYLGLTTRVTSPMGTTETILNAAGLVDTIRTNGKYVAYGYDAAERQVSTLPEGGIALTTEYDLQGRRTKLVDPDAGEITSVYDGWGQLKEVRQHIHSSTVPVITNYTYFDNGLVKSHRSSNSPETSYQYDDYYRLKKTSQSGGHSREVEYGPFDRIVKVTDQISGKTFESQTAYDALGRITSETYPGGYAVSYAYNDFSNLLRVSDNKGNTAWEADESNVRSQWERVKLGSSVLNYAYDAKHYPSRMWLGSGSALDLRYGFDHSTGNLSSYADHIKGLQESYEYDALNRLKKWTVSGLNGQNSTSWSQQYQDVSGNIESKTGFGTNLEYGSKPHALVSFTPSSSALYGEEQSLEYTDFKKVKKIKQGTKSLSITYGVDQQRIFSEMRDALGTTQHYYIGNYEEINTGNTTQKLHFISGGSGLAGIYIQNASGSGTFYSVYTDYKGSLIALADKNGTIVEDYAYDPWGLRRDPSGWVNRDTRNLITDRGYTMHEHLPAFNLIDMNGRMYDPQAGLFLSPDPYVQSPDNWLNFNRYSYCLNNPLMYTDPSGEFVFSALLAPFGLAPLGIILDGACWGAVFGAVSYTMSTVASPGGFDNWSMSGLGNSMLVGAVSGAVFTGMGVISPSFTVSSTVFSKNLPTYLGKAGWSALTAAASTGAGMLMSDYLDDGSINTFGEDYLKGMGIAGLTSGALSFGRSIHNYQTWDRFTVKEKIQKLSEEFRVRISHYYPKESGRYGEFVSERSRIFISDQGLSSRSIARTTINHELVHFRDVSGLRERGITSIFYGELEDFTERNAYTSNLRNANKYKLTWNVWFESARSGKKYEVSKSSYYSFNLPLILRNIY